jgi:methylmalonyl-CoA/ethylmalonyl-CoA epimerase
MDLGLGRIGQIALSSADIEASIRFYTEVMGLRLIMRPQPGMAFFDCAGQSLLVSLPEGGESAKSGGAVLYFDCPDMAVCVRELEARGVKFIHAPHRVAPLPTFDLWMAFFEDPNKNLLALRMQAPKGYAYPKD